MMLRMGLWGWLRRFVFLCCPLMVMVVKRGEGGP